jgi:amino acid transporter
MGTFIPLVIIAVTAYIFFQIRNGYKHPEKLDAPRIIRKGSNCGIFLQFVGLLLLFSLILTGFGGLIGGIILMAIGGKMNRNYICSSCRNPIASRDVRLCPACKAVFFQSSQPSAQPAPKEPEPKPAPVRQVYEINENDI